MVSTRDLDTAQYRALGELRYQIRRFLTFSETAARAAHVEPQQHQLLLVLKALRPQERPTVRVVAERLQIRHNSAVDLVKRSAERGLVERRTGKQDAREASLHITPAGQRVLRRLSIAHRSELRSAAPALVAALHALVGPAKSAELLLSDSHPRKAIRDDA
jgi:DNA-binding MarR family transcriptional regulator